MTKTFVILSEELDERLDNFKIVEGEPGKTVFIWDVEEQALRGPFSTDILDLETEESNETTEGA